MLTFCINGFIGNRLYRDNFSIDSRNYPKKFIFNICWLLILYYLYLNISGICKKWYRTTHTVRRFFRTRVSLGTDVRDRKTIGIWLFRDTIVGTPGTDQT